MAKALNAGVRSSEAPSPGPSRREGGKTRAPSRDVIPQAGPQRYLADHVFASPALPVSVSQHRLDGDYESHDHDFLELAFITGGRGLHRTIHGDRALASGDAVFLRPGEWHAYLRCRGLRVTNCCFGLAPMRRELAWLTENPSIGLLLAGRVARPMVLALGPAAQRACGAALDAMRREFAQPDAAGVRLLAWLTLLLSEVAGALPADAMREAAQSHPAVDAVTELCRTRLQDDLTLTMLAEYAGLDAAYLVRLFGKYVGLPPMAYVMHLRLERAATLLLRTELPVSEIAQAVGVYDANYFTRRFRGRFGLTPTVYRAKRHAT